MYLNLGRPVENGAMFGKIGGHISLRQPFNDIWSVS